MTRAVVVGAGLGGLSAAVRLALAGFAVDVYESAAGPGGKAAERRLGGFRFDTGPSLVTLAEVWDELFAAAGKRRQDYLKLSRLDPVSEAFWPDARMTVPAGPEALAEAFARTGWAEASAVKDYLARSRELWELAGPVFLRRSLHDPATWATAAFWKTLLQAGRLDAGRSLKDRIDRSFADPRVRQFFGRYATYNGSDPRRLPATFGLIPWVEFGLGAWSADDGIYAIPRAMAQLASELGVQFHYRAPVEAILHREGRIRGVKLTGDPVPVEAPVVVANADVGPLYRLLEARGPLPPAAERWRQRYRKGEPSTAGVVFLWGISRSFPQLRLHNLFFSPDHDAEFQALFHGRLPEDPTVYVNITAKTTPRDAPPGQENWFVLVNAPHDPGPERIAAGPALARLREAVLDRIEANLGQAVRPHLAAEAVLTPADLEAATGSPGGSLYGLASHRPLAAFDRHPNRAPGFRGLYVCGGSAHPGGGMPLAVLSGGIAADWARRDFGPRPRN